MRSLLTVFLLGSVLLLSGCNDDNDQAQVNPPVVKPEPGCKIHCAP